jgi:amidohydrolase
MKATVLCMRCTEISPIPSKSPERNARAVLVNFPAFCCLATLARISLISYFNIVSPAGSLNALEGKGIGQRLRHLQRIIHEHRPDITPYIDTYKNIHQHPELSCFESRTALVVAKCLKDIGLEVTTSVGGNGVVGVLKNGPGKTVLLRAELDALPIQEKTGLPYASKVRMKDVVGQDQPVMHACGHDVHIACLLSSLHLLHSATQEWSGTVLAIFQPNEEIPGGARAIVDGGLYDICPRPDVMLAQHVGMSKAGLVAVRTGPVLPASDYIDITIVSEGVGSNPTECPEPVSLSSYIITRFQRIISSEIDRSEFATLVCREFHAGEPGALYTNCVSMRLEAKTCDSGIRDQIFEAVKAITHAECGVFGGKTKASVEMIARAPVTLNDTRLAETLQDYFGQHFGDKFWIPPMDTPVEDFSILGGSSPVPFVYWKLGSTEPAKWERKGGSILEHLPTNHSPEFARAPELTISTGMEAMALATLIFLG